MIRWKISKKVNPLISKDEWMDILLKIRNGGNEESSLIWLYFIEYGSLNGFLGIRRNVKRRN